MALSFIAWRTFSSPLINGKLTGITTMDMDDSIDEPVSVFMPTAVIVRATFDTVTVNATLRINSASGSGDILTATALSFPAATSGNRYQIINLTPTPTIATLVARTADAQIACEVTVGATATQCDLHVAVVGLVSTLGY